MAERYQYTGSTYRKGEDLNSWATRHREPALEPDLPIIDPHHHLWEDHRGRYLFHELVADINTGHNIIATVFIEAGAMYRAVGPTAMQPVGEVEFANGAAAMSASGGYGKARICSGIIGHADLMLGDQVRPVLEGIIAAGNGRLRGVRFSVPCDSGPAGQYYRRPSPPHLILDPTFRRGFAHLQPLGLSYDIWFYYPQLPDLSNLLRAFPDTQVVLDHVGGVLGLPPHDGKREEVFGIWRGHMRELAQFPNLNVKVGGLGMLTLGWDFHLRDAPPGSEELSTAWRPYVQTAIELFGPKRCMMESNFPVDKQSCDYGVLWNALKRITQNYSLRRKRIFTAIPLRGFIGSRLTSGAA